MFGVKTLCFISSKELDKFIIVTYNVLLELLNQTKRGGRWYLKTLLKSE